MLDEKEKRLAIKEELISCKERMLGLQHQNERLRTDLSRERDGYRSVQISQAELQLGKVENLTKETGSL